MKKIALVPLLAICCLFVSCEQSIQSFDPVPAWMYGTWSDADAKVQFTISADRISQSVNGQTDEILNYFKAASGGTATASNDYYYLEASANGKSAHYRFNNINSTTMTLSVSANGQNTVGFLYKR